MMARTPARLQGGATDCAAACLGIVLAHYGHDHSIHDLRQYCKVGRDGATIAQLRRGVQSLGHQCSVTKKGLEALKGARMPLILYWDLHHFVVLEGIRNGTAWLNDPAVGHRKLPIDQFQRHYTGICIEVRPSPHAEATTEGRPVTAMSLVKLVRHFPAVFWAGIIPGLLLFFLELLFGSMTRTLFDYVVEYRITDWGYILALAGSALLTVRFALKHLQAVHATRIELNLTTRLHLYFLRQLFSKPASFFDTHFAGETFSRFKELEHCLQFFVRLLNEAGPHLLVIALALIILWFVAPLIALVNLVPFLFLLSWTQLRQDKLRELEIRIHQDSGRYDSFLVQRSDRCRRYYATGMQDHLIATSLPLLSRRQAALAAKARCLLGHAAAARTVQSLALPLTAFAGAYLMIEGTLTYGRFMLASAMSVLLIRHLEVVTERARQYLALRPIVRRAAEVLMTPHGGPENTDPTMALTAIPQRPDKAGQAFIEAREIDFSYSESTGDLFRKVSLRIMKGETVCISGPSGRGKTTLLQLLSGQRPPAEGTILYRGQPLTGPMPAGFVFADDDFVEGSLASFIAGCDEWDADRLAQALRRTELWDRLGFFVGSDGRECLEDQGLSRGEIQRLLLAQALYRSDEVIFFDEAFSHISTAQSARIIRELRNNGTTLILATHRPEIHALCDRHIDLA